MIDVIRIFPSRCLLALVCWWLLVEAQGIALASGSASSDAHGAAAAAPEHESDSPIRGVSLGEFRIRTYHPVEAKRSTLIFTLYAIVSSEEAPEFRTLIENRRHKVRDQIIVSSRLAPLAEFNQPKLDEFRRRILLRLRRTLPELKIDDICVSDFQLEVRGI